MSVEFELKTDSWFGHGKHWRKIPYSSNLLLGVLLSSAHVTLDDEDFRRWSTPAVISSCFDPQHHSSSASMMIPRRAMLATKRQSLRLASCVGKAAIRLRQPQPIKSARYATAVATTTSPPSCPSSQLLLLQRQPTIRASRSPLQLVTSSNTKPRQCRFATTSTSTGTSGKAKPNTKKADDASQSGSLYFVKAGLPLLLFSLLGAWVVSNGIEGKNKERDAFQGRMSK